MLADFNYPLEIAPPEERTRFSAIASAAAGVGSFIGPLIAAVLLQFLDPRPVLLIAGAIRGVSLILIQLTRPQQAEGLPIAPSTGAA